VFPKLPRKRILSAQKKRMRPVHAAPLGTVGKLFSDTRQSENKVWWLKKKASISYLSKKGKSALFLGLRGSERVAFRPLEIKEMGRGHLLNRGRKGERKRNSYSQPATKHN